MALLYFKDEKTEGKQWMGKTTVRKLLERRDETIAEWKEKAGHRWLRIHQLHGEIEKLQEDKKVLEKERKALWIVIGILGVLWPLGYILLPMLTQGR